MSDYRKPLPKTAFDEFKLSLIGPKPADGGRAPTLKVSVINNSPRLTVFTRVPNDDNRGMLVAAMDTLTMFALLEQLKDVTVGEKDRQHQTQNYVGGPGQQALSSTTYVGKDTEGRVYISVQAEGRPKIKFLFLPSDWHIALNKDGTKVPDAELTVLYAKAWTSLMTELVPNILDSYYTVPDYANKDNAGGGGGKTYDKSGHTNSGFDKGGYNKEAINKAESTGSFSSDDFPM